MQVPSYTYARMTRRWRSAPNTSLKTTLSQKLSQILVSASRDANLGLPQDAITGSLVNL